MCLRVLGKISQYCYRTTNLKLFTFWTVAVSTTFWQYSWFLFPFCEASKIAEWQEMLKKFSDSICVIFVLFWMSFIHSRGCTLDNMGWMWLFLFCQEIKLQYMRTIYFETFFKCLKCYTSVSPVRRGVFWLKMISFLRSVKDKLWKQKTTQKLLFFFHLLHFFLT